MKRNKMKKAVVLAVILLFFAVTIASVNVNARRYGNSPPNKPQKPDGPTGGGIIFNRVVVGNSYTYTTVTTDPEEDDVYYKWDWGDGTFSDWDGPWTSGMDVEGSHTWAESGIYEVRVKAKDIHGANSSWSDPLTVTVSNKLSSVNMGSMVIGAIEMHSGSALLKKLSI